MIYIFQISILTAVGEAIIYYLLTTCMSLCNNIFLGFPLILFLNTSHNAVFPQILFIEIYHTTSVVVRWSGIVLGCLLQQNC